MIVAHFIHPDEMYERLWLEQGLPRHDAHCPVLPKKIAGERALIGTFNEFIYK
jgi:hypothetical protein